MIQNQWGLERSKNWILTNAGKLVPLLIVPVTWLTYQLKVTLKRPLSVLKWQTVQFEFWVRRLQTGLRALHTTTHIWTFSPSQLNDSRAMIMILYIHHFMWPSVSNFYLQNMTLVLSMSQYREYHLTRFSTAWGCTEAAITSRCLVTSRTCWARAENFSSSAWSLGPPLYLEPLRYLPSLVQGSGLRQSIKVCILAALCAQTVWVWFSFIITFVLWPRQCTYWQFLSKWWDTQGVPRLRWDNTSRVRSGNENGTLKICGHRNIFLGGFFFCCYKALKSACIKE